MFLRQDILVGVHIMELLNGLDEERVVFICTSIVRTPVGRENRDLVVGIIGGCDS